MAQRVPRVGDLRPVFPVASRVSVYVDVSCSPKVDVAARIAHLRAEAQRLAAGRADDPSTIAPDRRQIAMAGLEVSSSRFGFERPVPGRHLSAVPTTPRWEMPPVLVPTSELEARASAALDELIDASLALDHIRAKAAREGVDRIFARSVAALGRAHPGPPQARCADDGGEAVWWVRTARATERFLRGARAATVLAPRSWWGWAGPIWTAIGMGLTVGASWALVAGQVGAAFGLVAFRLAVSALLPPPYSIGSGHAARTRTSFESCVAGHVTDLIALGGVALALVAAGRTGWAGFVGVGCVAMIGGTIYRLAAMQTGDYVRRLSLERAFRNGALVIALGVTCVAGIGAVVPAAGFAAIGALLYAVVEIVRVRRRHIINEERRRLMAPDAQVADRQRELITAVGDLVYPDGGGQAADSEVIAV